MGQYGSASASTAKTWWFWALHCWVWINKMEKTGLLSGQRDAFSWSPQPVVVKDIISTKKLIPLHLRKPFEMSSSESAPVGPTSLSNTSSASNLLYLLLLQQSPGLLWHPCALLGWSLSPADLGHGTRIKSTRAYVKEVAQRQLSTSRCKR